MFTQTIRFATRTARIGVIAASLAMVACTGGVSPAREQLDLRRLDAVYNPCTQTSAGAASVVTEHIQCLAQITQRRVAVANFHAKEV